MKLVYQGHNHVVFCDEKKHIAKFWSPQEHKMVEQTQCLCFCKDGEFIEKGWSMELQLRYII